MNRFIIYLVPILLLLAACKNDPQTTMVHDHEKTEEEKYFDDYAKPRFLWSYLDRTGKVVMKNKFDECGNFSEGLAQANKNGKWGYINKSGEFVIQPQFRSAWEFKEGRAKVRDFEGNFYFLDKSGQKIIELGKTEPSAFTNGISMIDNFGVIGYIDLEGNEIHAPNFNGGTIASEDAFVGVKRGMFWGVLDRDGNEVIPFEFDKIYKPREGHFKLKKQGKFSLFNPTTRSFIKKDVDKITNIQNNTYAWFDGEKWTISNSENENLYSTKAKSIRPGGNDFWYINKTGKFTINKSDGSLVNNNEFSMLYNFTEGIAAFAIDKNWGYINSEGEIIVPPKYPLVWEHVNGLARVIDSRGISYIDTKGRTIFSTPYFETRDFHDGVARVQLIK